MLSYKEWNVTYWQSMRSVMPPCPGILCPKSLMSNARLNPEAKNPPKGATNDAKQERKKRWKWYCVYGMVSTACPSYARSIQELND